MRQWSVWRTAVPLLDKLVPIVPSSLLSYRQVCHRYCLHKAAQHLIAPGRWANYYQMRVSLNSYIFLRNVHVIIFPILQEPRMDYLFKVDYPAAYEAKDQIARQYPLFCPPGPHCTLLYTNEAVLGIVNLYRGL